MTEVYANQAATTLSSGYTAGGTTLTVSSASVFPGSGSFRILIGSEYMLVHYTNSTTLTIDSHGIEGSSNANHLSGVAVTHVLTAGGLQECVNQTFVPAGSDTDIQLNQEGAFAGSGSLTFDGSTFHARGDLVAVEPASGSVNYNVSQAYVAIGTTSSMSWTFNEGPPANSAVVGGTYTINGSPTIAFNADASAANGYPYGWTYSGNPSGGTITGTGPAGSGQSGPTLDSSGLTDNGSMEWDADGGTVTPTFTDGTNPSSGTPMIATITVVGDSGTWDSGGLNYNATAADVFAVLGLNSGAGDAVTLAFTSPDTYTYTITAYSGDYSMQVADLALKPAYSEASGGEIL